MTVSETRADDLHARIRQLGFQNRHHYLEVALGRNRGLVSTAEQERLLDARIAIPGLGGVGGSHLITLTRMGFGGFRLAEFDHFEPANVNRQYGARIEHFERPKLDAMVAEARQINPYLDLTLFPEGVSEQNVSAFLEGADIVVDGIDFFAFDVRRLIFNRAREMGIPVVTAGPVGFSTAMLVFMPDQGMTFDEYFDIRDDMPLEEKLLAFLIGLAPRAAQRDYIDPSRIDLYAQQGPSVAAACQLCASVAATEAVRIVLKRPGVRPAPAYFQYDPLVRKFHRGRLRAGNRHPWQRFKLRRLKSRWLNGKGPLRAAWKAAPLIQSRPRTLIPAVRDYILQAAVHAPSGDNCQPWEFHVDRGQVTLSMRPEVDHSLFNVGQYATLIACGAAIENMGLAASRYGFENRVDYFPRSADPLQVADIHFQANGKKEDPLQRFIPERHTNRSAYAEQAIPPATLEGLQTQVQSYADVELELIEDRERRQEIAQLVWEADRIRLENRRLHAHFMHMVRFSAADALSQRDGLPLDNLEAGKGGNVFLRMTRPWSVMNLCNQLGASRLIARISYNAIVRTSAVGLVRCANISPQSFLDGGRALQRIWLAATRAGLDFQPMTAITLFRLRWQLGAQDDFPRHQRECLERIWPLYDELLGNARAPEQGHVMLFRIGYGRRAACRTLRRPLETFLR
ncbi:MAG: ThiF family adenylyltransferase [Desulfobacterales bacterium]|nr:ThiF family adenylyltransferase [Desulfobacterales bacterium]